MNILGIIPARGGSKGIRNKNIRILAGKPLIYYSIRSAKNSKINRIIVSTDDTKISKIAKSAGADVPFMRPKKFSKDSSSTLDVVNHAIDTLLKKENYHPDIITILQPTSPLRTSKMITNSINLLKKSKCTSVISVSKIKTHPYTAFWMEKNYLKPFKSNFTKFNRRQTFPSLYYPTGSIYTFWYDTLRQNNSIYGTRIKPMISKDEIEIDIDTPFDLFMSEMILLHWKKYRTKFFKKN